MTQVATTGFDQARYRKWWNLQRARGIELRVDSTRAREHIESLLSLGWSLRAIADAAGISPTTVSRQYRGLEQKITIRMERAILSVSADKARDRSGREFVPAVGVRRRIHALYAIGHTAETVAAACDLDATSVRNAVNAPGEWITWEKANQVSLAYDRLWNVAGPSPHNRGRAVSLGWAPPLAWDDETIDDPAAKPQYGARSKRPGGGRPVAEVIDDVEHLLDAGVALTGMAERLGYKDVDTLCRVLTRAGRYDLSRRVEARGASESDEAGVS